MKTDIATDLNIDNEILRQKFTLVEVSVLPRCKLKSKNILGPKMHQFSDSIMLLSNVTKEQIYTIT